MKEHPVKNSKPLLKRVLGLMFVFLATFHLWGQENIPLGTWRNHLSYRKGIDLAIVENRTYCITENGLFFFDREDNSLNKLSKIDGLSGVEATTISYQKTLQLILITYADGNIDIISKNEIVNFNVIQTADILGSKNINHVAFNQSLAYLSTDFGLVILDLGILEIREAITNLGVNGASVSIFATTFSPDSIFSATGSGIIASSLSENVNLQDFRNWKRFNLEGIDTNASIKVISAFNGNIYAGVDEQGIIRYNGSTWNKIFSISTGFKAMNPSSDQLLITTNNKLWQMDVDENFTSLNSSLVVEPSEALIDSGNNLWIADGQNGLVSNLKGTFKSIFPSGPFSNQIFNLESFEGVVVGLPGGYDQLTQPNRDDSGYYVFEKGQWTNFNEQTDPLNFGSLGVEDLVDARKSNLSEFTYFASFGHGLVKLDHLSSYQLIDENTNGSPLENANPPGRFTQISGLAVDQNGSLWITNHSAVNSLHQLTIGGTWESYSFNDFPGQFPLGIEISQNGDKWLRIDPTRGGGIIVFNEITNQERYLTSIPGQGGLPSNNVTSLVADLTDQIWIGTELGVAFFINPFTILDNQTVDAIVPIFDSRLLLEGELITALEVDGGNRKWIGTTNGIWLFEDAGEELVYNFRDDNSPLLSNNIIDIEVVSETGEVFIATDKGIVSFRADATEADPKHQNVKVFPNPVPLDFNGLVGISGLANDVIVKITDVSGKLIKEILSEGGTAVWDAADYNGRKAKAGIYLIFSTTPDGQETFIGKMAVLN